MVLTIITLVYGTYFTTARSVERCNANISSVQQVRTVLDNMTRQIRCCYQPPVQNIDNTSEKTIKSVSMIGGKDNSDGIILQLITTAKIFTDNEFPNGPFVAAYKFDPVSGVLFYSQKKYIPEYDSRAKDINWMPIADNIESIILSFYNGTKWLNKWDAAVSKYQQPQMIKIEMTCGNNKSSSINFSSITHVIACPAILTD